MIPISPAHLRYAASFMSTNPITFTEAKLPYGWLGNMAGGYPIHDQGVDYPSSEALFQCLRFPGDTEAQDAIRSASSGLFAKKRANPRAKRLTVPICDAADLSRMKLCLVLKLAQNPQLIAPLLATGAADMLETRKMHRAWAIKIRDQCKKAVVPFFFKQWGDFGEDGKPNTSAEGESDPPPQLDGTVYREYPVALR